MQMWAMLISSVTPSSSSPPRPRVPPSYKAGATFRIYFPPAVAVATSASWEDDGLECSAGMQIPSLGSAIGKCKHLQEQRCHLSRRKRDLWSEQVWSGCWTRQIGSVVGQRLRKRLQSSSNSRPRGGAVESSGLSRREEDKGCNDSAFGFYETQ